MSSTFLEIVALESGTVILQRADGKGEPLVKIEFSDETKIFLDHQTIDVGKAMISAGLSLVGEMYDLYETEEHSLEAGDAVIH